MMKGLEIFKVSVLLPFLLDKRCKGRLYYIWKSKVCFTLWKGRQPLENRIQELQKELSQEGLAEARGHETNDYFFRKGRYNASLLLAHKIASFFNLRIEEVSLFEEDKS